MVQKDSMINLLVICGPTASGKTALAIECAKLLDTEVVSADSMCVYRKCDIGTAKPTIEEQAGIPHHLIDVVSPNENFSVSDYREKALPIINGIIQKGKIPVICGGTGFYINSILYDLSYGKTSANSEVREYYENFLKVNGKEALHDLLKEKDFESAEKLHVNDTRRVIRALEIFDVSGKKKSDLHDDLTPNYNYLSFSIGFLREELYDRINRRVDIMMQEGLIKEIQDLLQGGITEENQCMQGIGYKEVCQGLKEGMSEQEIAELIKFNTRHYAKRQITFFKRDPRLEVLEKDDVSKLAKYIVGKIK